ncbi:MAG: hypothetical protein LAT75_14730 [Candidatus Cyclonatronum sp.]|uniref:hypothetical protein n=1 Tax=Cyclonatronum sp. TaxID=3024185 RepID=UPI0025BE5623|nr:hypothetical protein [Cyclonatronum sp.]MCH8488116.1 hypothetical protein [Cyclonatronum sp.]
MYSETPLEPPFTAPRARFASLWLFVMCALLLPALLPGSAAQAQVLRQMEVERVTNNRAFVFQDYPGYAAVYIESSIPNLSIASNLDIIADLSDPASGVYRVIILPRPQALYFRAPGYMEARMSTGVLNARQVIELRIDPQDRSITDTGDLLIRSEPSSATFTVEGLPGTYSTPHSFTNIIAQTYNIRVELPDHETKHVIVRVDPLRPTVRDVVLTPTFGFLNLNTPNATLFLATDEVPEYRVTYTPNRSIRLDTGTYSYRISRPNYEDETGRFTIEPGRTSMLEVSLRPTYGFLVVNTPDAQLFLRNTAGGDERLQPYQRQQPVQIDAGTYSFRVQRNFFQPVSGNITIRPGETSFLAPELSPDFATLRVRANAPNFQLRATDSNAPATNNSSEINLERGLRTVVVSAQGYADLSLRVNARPGERIDTTVVLESLAARQDRQRREQLPRGILNVSTDMPDAEIFINGERRGQGEISISVVPDSYEIEVRHPHLARQKSRVTVGSAAVVEQNLVLLPSKGQAVLLSALLPGTGHLYTNRNRGYFYLAGAAAAAGFTVWARFDYLAAGERYENAQLRYQQASSLEDAARYRADVLKEFGNQSTAYDNMMLGLAVFGGVYAVQMLDVLILRPRSGYRDSRQTVQAGFGPQGASLTLRF